MNFKTGSLILLNKNALSIDYYRITKGLHQHYLTKSHFILKNSKSNIRTTKQKTVKSTI